MIVQDEGIVLQVRDYSESSQIVALWTAGHGRVTGIAKGIRREGRAAFDGPFEPSCRYDLGFYARSRGEGLAILSEAVLAERFASVRETLEGWWAWSEAAEAVLALTQELDPHPGLFEALARLLREVAARPGALAAFQMALLEAAGNAPVLDRCVGCGMPLASGDRAAFAFWSGGTVCAVCSAGAGPLAVLSPAVRAGLAGDPAALQGGAARAAEGLLARYVAHVAGQAPEASWCRERARRSLARLRR